jgi:DNA-binding phage protein
MISRDSDLTPVLSTLIATAKARGLTQNSLAHMAHIAPETLSRMKNRGNADFSAVAALAKAVGLKIALVPDEDRQELIRQRRLVEFEPLTYDD